MCAPTVTGATCPRTGEVILQFPVIPASMLERSLENLARIVESSEMGDAEHLLEAVLMQLDEIVPRAKSPAGFVHIRPV